jgi:hypothetical protein
MTQKPPRQATAETLIKFYAPRALKQQLQELATSRNIALSAMLRLVVSEYVRTRQ